MTRIFIISAFLLLSACASKHTYVPDRALSPSEQRQCNRAQMLISRASALCPFLLQPVTLRDTTYLIVDSTSVDTLVMPGDTLFLEHCRTYLTAMPARGGTQITAHTPAHAVPIPFECDCPAIIQPSRYTVRSLSRWELFLMNAGGLFLIVILFSLILWLLRR